DPRPVLGGGARIGSGSARRQGRIPFRGPRLASGAHLRRVGEASHRVAAGLAALGVRHGDRVGALAPGSAMWPILQTACSHLGAIIVPINTRYREDELGFVLGLAEPAVMVLIGQ